MDKLPVKQSPDEPLHQGGTTFRAVSMFDLNVIILANPDVSL
jgi:hypothetical protein